MRVELRLPSTLLKPWEGVKGVGHGPARDSGGGTGPYVRRAGNLSVARPPYAARGAEA